MAFEVPMIARAFYSDAQVPAVRKALFSIKASNEELISQSSRLTGVAKELISSVIFIESAGRSDAESSAGAHGLMQLKAETAEDTLWLIRPRGC